MLVDTPVTLTKGVDYFVRLTFDGSLLAATLWKVSDPEPALPLISAVTTNVTPEKNTDVVLASDHPVEVYFAEVVEILTMDCDDGNPCTTGDQCSDGECVPGLPAAECGDFDHDGLMFDDDSCPYAFDPQELDLDDNGQADACEPLGDGYNSQRAIVLSQEGESSTWRRTNEPIEIPLANGIIDDSVVGYWKLDGDAIDSTGKFNGSNVSAIPTSDKLGGLGAMWFDGNEARVEVDDAAVEATNDEGSSLTVSLWFRADSLTAPGGDGGTLVYLARGGTSDLETVDLVLVKDGTMKASLRDKSGSAVTGSTPFSDTEHWHHLALRFDNSLGVAQVYLDGKLSITLSCNSLHKAVYGTIGAQRTDKHPNGVHFFVGSIDDVIIFDRALSPDEIETYYRSAAPYGTAFASGAQADFDDVRVTETGDDGKTYVTRSRVIGPRPHSDTPCPMDEDDGSWADREDLCGVVGYWKLDGNGNDVTGNHDGTPTGMETVKGRFGDTEGAFHYKLANDVVLVDDSPEFDLETGTVEMWLKPDACPEGNRGHAFVKNAGGVHNDLMITLEPDCRFKVYQDNDLSLYSQPITQTGVWTHLAFSWNGETEVLFIDGLPHATTSKGIKVYSQGNSIAIGAYKDGGDPVAHSFLGQIDDVVLHSVAKSPDYIFNRGRPGVPKVRFLANTVVENQGTDEAPAYPLREYGLHWGDDDAIAALPFVGGASPDEEPCYGLLNGCLGYAGWWRFNEGSGTVAVDSSGNKYNGVILEEVERGPGLEGAGVVLSGASNAITVPHSPDFDLQTFTVELAAQPNDVATDGEYLLAKMAPGPHDNYAMLLMEGKFRLQFEYPVDGGGIGDAILAGGQPQSGEWTWVTGQFDGAGMSVFHENEPVGSHVPPSGPYTDGETPLTIGHQYSGQLDSARIMNRALAADEMLHYPLVDWSL